MAFAATSVALMICSFEPVLRFVRTPNFDSLFWLTYLLLMASGCTLMASPRRLHKRYLLYLSVVTMILEIILNLLIVFKS